MKTDIKKHDFKAGLPQEFEIIDIKSIIEKHRNILTIPHRAGFYHIIWFQKGNPIHLVDFNTIQIKPNMFIFINKNVVQRYDKKVLFEGKAILFTDSFFCKTETDTQFLKTSILFSNLYSVCQFQTENELNIFADMIYQMTEELRNTRDNFQDNILQNLLHNFLLHSEREIRKQNFIEMKKGEDLDYVMLFNDLLEKGYKTHKQVSFYAKQINITEKRLNQATAEILGKTPKEIINERILLEAKRILVYTTERIKEIGFQLGFDEPTNFIKYFKKHSQLTPSEFREKFISE